MIRRNLARTLAFTILAATGVGAHAQSWEPKAPVRVIVPFDPGSTPDLLARVISERLGARLGQPMVVENKGGASGNIGTNAIAKAVPDGQTIGVSIAGPLGVNALLYKKMPYDPAKDIELVTIGASQPAVLVASAKMPVSNGSELLEQLRKNPKKYSFSSLGAGTASHLAMEVLAASVGADLVHVPYKGSGAAVTALIAGETDLAVLPAAAVVPHIKAGRLKALAIASAKRSALLSELPTMSELGVSGVTADAWIGFVAPGKTPPAILNRLQREIAQILAEPSVREKLLTQYMEPVGNTPSEFRAVVAADVARWKPVIQKHKIELD
jgi:tripartite-type tricarboxylate transporter receptor subunit TctC